MWQERINPTLEPSFCNLPPPPKGFLQGFSSVNLSNTQTTSVDKGGGGGRRRSRKKEHKLYNNRKNTKLKIAKRSQKQQQERSWRRRWCWERRGGAGGWKSCRGVTLVVLKKCAPALWSRLPWQQHIEHPFQQNNNRETPFFFFFFFLLFFSSFKSTVAGCCSSLGCPRTPPTFCVHVPFKCFVHLFVFLVAGYSTVLRSLDT